MVKQKSHNSSSLRIVHVNNLAFVSSTTAEFQRRHGHSVHVITTWFNKVTENNIQKSLHGDIHVSSTISKYSYKSLELRLKTIVDIARLGDKIHVHGWSLLPFRLDLIYWKLCGKELFYHYHGSDLRGKKEQLIPKLVCYKRFVSTPDLLTYASKGTEWLPNPIDTEKITVSPHTLIERVKERERERTLRILHAPSNPKIKGTIYIESAITLLKQEGYNIEFICLKNRPHDEVLQAIAESDLVIDQILLGWYGVFAMEAMTLGKPVCVYIEESLTGYIPPNTIINTNKDMIYNTIKNILEREINLYEIGNNGQKYVEMKHSEKAIMEIYNSIY